MNILEKLKKILFVTYNLKHWILIFLLGLILLFIAIIIGFYTYLARFISFLSIKFLSALSFNASTKGIIAFFVFVIAIITLFYSIYKIYKYFSKYNEKLIEKTFLETKLSKGPKIVTIGGGTGQYTSLYGLKNHTSNISAIVTTMDSGGSSQILKTEFGILPPGDLRNSILALSTLNEKQTNIFKLRFNKSNFKGHPIGNLVLTKLTEDLGLKEAIKEFSDLLRIRGKVFPVTYNKCELIAKLENGSTVYGETNIDTKALGIKKIYLSKKVKLNPDIPKIIKNADLIIIGPGDLFSSIIPNLLVDNLSKLITKSKAKKIYVCNVFTKYPETYKFKAQDYINWIEQFIKLDYILFNNKKPKKNIINNYLKEKQTFIEPITTKNSKYILKNVINNKNVVRHDSYKLANEIIKLVK